MLRESVGIALVKPDSYSFETCEHIPGRQFRSGSYKCMCRQGFEYPFNDLTWFFDGETMEKEYDLMIRGQKSRYDLLKCRQGLAMSLRISVGLMIASVMSSLVLF
ncbi:unnamed protein product [Rodentolepis nana]|uniref:Ig-like domain-containing protein n=1 Tax=Rodentolepis nana TaxID=102285 RepID=A0A0R3TCR3_RODNA|nr:unnamed protein product [Rodentolepis nana]